MLPNGGYGFLGHHLEEVKKTDRKVFGHQTFASHWLKITVNMFPHETWISSDLFPVYLCPQKGNYGGRPV